MFATNTYVFSVNALHVKLCLKRYVSDKFIHSFGPPLFLATDPEARVRFPALPPPPPKVVGLERAPLSLVSTTEELLDRKVAAPV
jgi:hypothetical protein